MACIRLRCVLRPVSFCTRRCDRAVVQSVTLQSGHADCSWTAWSLLDVLAARLCWFCKFCISNWTSSTKQFFVPFPDRFDLVLCILLWSGIQPYSIVRQWCTEYGYAFLRSPCVCPAHWAREAICSPTLKAPLSTSESTMNRSGDCSCTPSCQTSRFAGNCSHSSCSWFLL